jgi:hypothetical protein
VGKGLELLYHGQVSFSHEAKRSMYREALERGREFGRSLVQPRP